MNIINFFHSRSGPAAGTLLQQADEATALHTQKRAQLEATRLTKLHRQVELWSVLTPSPELEAEYRTVSEQITAIIAEQIAIDEQIKQLGLARFHCQNGQCEELEGLLSTKEEAPTG